jgi:hypothetical protein
MTDNRTIESAATHLSELASQSKHDRKVLIGLTAMLLPRIRPCYKSKRWRELE